MELTPGARIDLEEPARALRSIIGRGMVGGKGKKRGGCEKPVIGNIRSARAVKKHLWHVSGSSNFFTQL